MFVSLFGPMQAAPFDNAQMNFGAGWPNDTIAGKPGQTE
jgi:hypothetical protein